MKTGMAASTWSFPAARGREVDVAGRTRFPRLRNCRGARQEDRAAGAERRRRGTSLGRSRSLRKARHRHGDRRPQPRRVFVELGVLRSRAAGCGHRAGTCNRIGGLRHPDGTRPPPSPGVSDPTLARNPPQGHWTPTKPEGRHRRVSSADRGFRPARISSGHSAKALRRSASRFHSERAFLTQRALPNNQSRDLSALRIGQILRRPLYERRKAACDGVARPLLDPDIFNRCPERPDLLSHISCGA